VGVFCLVFLKISSEPRSHDFNVAIGNFNQIQKHKQTTRTREQTCQSLWIGNYPRFYLYCLVQSMLILKNILFFFMTGIKQTKFIHKCLCVYIYIYYVYIYAYRIKLGKGDDGKPVNYRKLEMYEMKWMYNSPNAVNMRDSLIAGCKHGGAVAMTIDPNKVVTYSGKRQYVFIYSCDGSFISKFEWVNSEGKLIHIGWTDDERVICVSE
jgi:hypothetical protein